MTGPGRFAVVLAGGGTTGHVAPLLATAAVLQQRHPGLPLAALGTAAGLEARLVPEQGIDLRLLPRVPLPRRLSGDVFRLPARLRAAVEAARSVVEELAQRPGVERVVVVGFGGYVAAPAYLAGRRAGARLVVHEANSRPGIANRLGARLTRHVATAFPGTPLPHARHLGMPLRQEITDLDRAALRPAALEHFGLRQELPTLLVTGGSLGAQRLNETFGRSVAAIRAAGVQVIHVTGRGKALPPTVSDDPDATGGPDTTGGDGRAATGGDGPAATAGLSGDGPAYVVREYLDRMDLAYAAADMVTCRSGAGTVCELTAVGLPAAYVPLPVGNGEQRLNAAPVVAAGGGLLVEDAACTPGWVSAVLLPLLADPGRLAAMALAARGFGITDGAQRLCDLIEDAAVADGDMA